jgi:DNA-binding NarL/FixJ family response regulator
MLSPAQRHAGLPDPSRMRLFARDDSLGPGKQTGKPRRILIIEDDVLVATQMEGALGEQGFDVIGIASNGEDALGLARKRSPDMAIIDIKLAGDRDGVDTAIELFRSHGVRCIFATAYADPESRRRAGPARPLGWLPKPYPVASLIELVRRAFGELGPT